MLLLLIGCAVPLWLSSYANALWQFLLLGLALGLVGASFSVGTPYVARFFPKERRGLAMGIFGAGTLGAALNMFVAPGLINSYGWESVPKVYAVALLVTAIVFWIFSAPDPGAIGSAAPSMRNHLPSSAIRASGNIASTIRSSSAASRRCRSGRHNISRLSTVSRSRRHRCWLPASRCQGARSAPLVAGCPIALAPTRSLGGCCGPPGFACSRTPGTQSG
jgi:MFS family permease